MKQTRRVDSAPLGNYASVRVRANHACAVHCNSARRSDVLCTAAKRARVSLSRIVVGI